MERRNPKHPYDFEDRLVHRTATECGLSSDGANRCVWHALADSSPGQLANVLIERDALD